MEKEMEKEITISRKAKSFKRICACCHRALAEDDGNLCPKCDEIAFEVMMDRYEEAQAMQQGFELP